MLNTIMRKRARVLALILVLSLLITATAAFATTRLIKAKQGGKINIAPGVRLVIHPGALDEDTVISADMALKKDRIYFTFQPAGLEFNEPAELQITWKAINAMGSSRDLKRCGLEDLTLYGDNGLKIEPEIMKQGVRYHLDHFSLYYFRRR